MAQYDAPGLPQVEPASVVVAATAPEAAVGQDVILFALVGETYNRNILCTSPFMFQRLALFLKL